MARRRNDDFSTNRLALVLGGGAPTLTLMAGALLALDEEGVEFDVVSTSGAGMLVGLLSAAPKGGDRRAALRQTVHLGVHDAIYRHFPVNFKVFYKPGPLAEIYYRALMPWVQALPQATSEQRLFRDLVHLWVATWSPSDMTADSLGMCAAAPWLEEVVDFDALRDFPSAFFINAWNIRAGEMEIFAKEQITADHFRAALAFPLIYPPFPIAGDHYIEGSALDTLNLEGLLRYDAHYDEAYPELLRQELLARWLQIARYANHPDGESEAAIDALVREAELAAHEAALAIRVRPELMSLALAEAPGAYVVVDEATMREVPAVARALDYEHGIGGEINAIGKIVVFDALGTSQLVRKPRNLYDAWVMQMIVPLVAISNAQITQFERDYDFPHGDPRKYLHRLRFADQIAHDHWINVLDWSYSNLETLFHAGYRAGKAFYAKHEWLQQRTMARLARRVG